ncbi:MAG: transposase [Thermoplasmata archaeon]
MGVFSEKVNVAIDEHDEPYYGKDNKYLINVGKKKFRGTDKRIRIAILDAVMEEKRATVAFMPKHSIDGIDNSKEVEILLNKAINLGIKINLVLVDRGYLDVGVLRNIENLGLKYIVPEKENPKTKNFMNYPLQYSSIDELSDGKNRVASNFVRVRYWNEGKFHDFAFYTNVEVTENNVMELAETYRKRWGG